MKLVDLDPNWVGHGGEGITQNGQPVPRREKIALSFNCPCGNGEGCVIYIKNPPDGGPPVGEPNWTMTGETFENLSLQPSIQRRDPGGCNWHGYLTNGEFRSV